MTKKKISALRLPSPVDSYVPVNIRELTQYDPPRDVDKHGGRILAIFMPQSMVELLVVERATNIDGFVLNSEEEIEAGFIGHYKGWPCVTDVLGYGPKLNFLTPQLVPLLNEPRLAYNPAGVSLLPDSISRYSAVDVRPMPDNISESEHPNTVLLISTQEVFFQLAGEDWFNEKFIPTSSPKLRQRGYLGNFDGLEVVAPNVHDSVFVPMDLEAGVYVVELDDLPSGESLQVDHDGTGPFDEHEQLAPNEMVGTTEDPLGEDNKPTRSTIPLYVHLAQLGPDHFRKLDTSKFEDLESAPRIAEDEIYFVSESMWNYITGSVLPVSECDPSVLETTESYVEVIAGYIGRLHGRHIVSDAFAMPQHDLPRRADLDGLYAIKASLVYSGIEP